MKICVRFKGDFYTHEFTGYKSLKEVVDNFGFDRKLIKEWWKERS